MKLRTVLFDLDGTLIDSLEDMRDCVNRVLEREGYPPRTLDQIRMAVGDGAGMLIRRSLPKDATEERAQQVLEQYRREYAAHLADKTRPYPGIPEMLRRLKEQGVSLGLLSNKPHWGTEFLAEQLFTGLFSLAWGDQPGRPRKPDPAGVLAAMAQLNASPETTAYVGDSPVDIATGKNAGILSIAVCWGFRDRETLAAHSPDYLCSTVEELGKLLESL